VAFYVVFGLELGRWVGIGALGCTRRRVETLGLGPGRLHWVVHAPYTPSLGSKRRVRVVHAGVGSYTPTFRLKRWCWVLHVRVRLYTLSLGRTSPRRVRDVGGGAFTLAMGLYTPAFGLKCRCWVPHVRVVPYTLALSPTRRC
jgi:hypothetical protein